MVIGDFNNDDQTDFIFPCKFTENIEIMLLLNNGNSTFQNSIIFLLSNSEQIQSIHIVDFNNDHRSDISVIHGNEMNKKLTILLNNGNKTFHNSTTFLLEKFYRIHDVHLADFNNDNQYDILLTRRIIPKENLVVLLGNNKGRFQEQIMVSSTIFSFLMGRTKVHDFNNDDILDIVLDFEADKNIGIMWGLGNGSFSTEFLLFKKESITFLQNLAVTDVNNDDYLDIIVYEKDSKHIYVLFGNINGTFQIRKSLFTIIMFSYYTFQVIGDFDNDNRSDIVFIYNDFEYIECTIYYYHNNKFTKYEKISIENIGYINSVTVHDLNNDNYLDLIFDMQDQNIYVLFGYGNKQFYFKPIYWNKFPTNRKWMIITDFNDDKYDDIIVDVNSQTIDVLLSEREFLIN
ncbi:unnamed protein product [Adineta ricciae]|uniref:VCBS repeat-containing protein n=1 Tax=Adineta ricciae TaxID=249248 RepID=A0A816AAX0_ADIRI|nr:unnamed protein product [Adineta ricciae]